MKKRLFALFLCLCMVMTLLPVGAFAEGTEAQSGLAAGGASVTSVNPVETPDTHITFKFYNGETLLDTQVVNDDGQLTAPATPAIESGRKFLGWYAVDANGQLEAQEFNFSTAYTNYSGRSEVKVMAKIEESMQEKEKGGKGAAAAAPEAGEDEGDELLPAAVEVVLETGQASVSMLQRRLKLGYSRAARLVDQREERGIVGPFEGSKPRQLLITRAQWQEMQMGGAPAPEADEPPFPTEEET